MYVMVKERKLWKENYGKKKVKKKDFYLMQNEKRER